MDPPPTPAPGAERHAGIHGLRGACVLAIFAYHVVNSGLVPQAPQGLLAALRWLSDGLRYGVEVFFMISGYVIVHSLQRHGSAGAFLRDRALRIFPLWLPLAVVMVLGMVLAAKEGGASSRWLEAPALLIPSLLILAPVLPVPAIHPAQWSLCYELFFYAFAATAWTVRRRAPGGWILWLVPAGVFVALFPRALFFIPGVVIALWEPWFQARRRAFRWAWLGLPLAWLAWLSTGANDAGWSRTLFDYTAQGLAGAAVLALLGATLFFSWLVLFRAHAVRGVLASKSMQWLGTVSFSFYLLHPLVMAAVKRLLPVLHLDTLASIEVFVVLSFAVSCIASHLTWRFLEVRLRRRLLSHRPVRPPVALP